MLINRLVLKDVRCFRSVEAPLAPLTLLVGENSTGKTSFLALLRLAFDLVRPRTGALDFNDEPFRLGAYDEIAHYHGGQGKRAREFTLGLARLGLGKGDEVRWEATLKNEAGQPSISKFVIAIGKNSIHFHASKEITVSAYYVIDGKTFQIEYFKHIPIYEIVSLAFLAPPPVFESDEARTDFQEFRQAIRRVFWDDFVKRQRPFATAPIRSAPKRTYDPVRETPDASGGHAPMVLARLAASDPKEWERMSHAIARFGQACGLLENIKVKRASKHEGDPFQVHVEINGQRRSVNLIDVGYGVSQVLPILVDGLLAPKGSWLLLQQPEVHLHPRAQAELGSFLGQLARSGHNLVVETHSDYLIDRVCMDVREGKGPKAGDVVILHFERVGPAVEVHAIRVDPQGNLLGAPPTYRDFFRREQARHIGITHGAV